MSKKVFNVFSILCFALVLCFIGCTELINPKTETDINLNIDLSKIIKSTRNTEETQSSVSIGENPTIKVAIYDAKKYTANTNSTDNLDLITEAQAKIVNDEAKVKLNNIPVGIDAIVFAELSFSNENSTEVMYAGNSGVFKVKASDNKIRLVLKKVGNSELFPDDSNTPYKISSWEYLEIKINELSDVTTTTVFIITENLTATKTITVSKPVKIISNKEVTITRGSEFSGEFFYIDTGSLELGSNENKIILDGGNQNNINATDPLIWECSTGQDLTLTNCTLQYNTLNNTDGFGNGGAVKVESNFTMNNSSIIECFANVNGGAVYVSGGTFTMNDGVTITNCFANENGGAVYITGKGTFNMNGGSISECYANSGGGVCMDNGSSFTMFGGSKIEKCKSSVEGGGVYVTGEDNLCTFKMLDATITRCSADNGGGVSYDCGPNGTFEILENAEISNNEAYGNDGNGGGGIYLYGKLTMTGGTISGNQAPSGAGVYVRDDSSFTMTYGTISNNLVNGINKGASIYCNNTNATVYLPGNPTVTFTSGMFTQNIINGEIQDLTTGGGGNATQSISTFSDLRSAITDANTNSSSYTLENPCVIYIGNSFLTDDDTTASTLTISTHVKLVANNTDGCTITKTSGYAGTNIFTVSSDASLTLGDENATGILTIDGGGGDVESTKSLINVSGTLVLNEKSVLQNNICIDDYNSSNGSAVYSDGGNIQIKGGEIKNNQILREKIYGGGIYLTNGTFEMTSGIFQGNSTDSSGKMYGGALYFSSCTVVITGGTFYNNSVTSTNTECCGGAIYIISSGTNDSPTQISNCTFTSNSAYQNGGAIYIGGTTCIDINNCTFNDNSVTNSTANGGAIYVANTSGGPVTILDCNFANNTANSSENTIYHYSSSSENISVTVDGTAVANKSVWNPSNSGGD